MKLMEQLINVLMTTPVLFQLTLMRVYNRIQHLASKATVFNLQATSDEKEIEAVNP